MIDDDVYQNIDRVLGTLREGAQRLAERHRTPSASWIIPDATGGAVAVDIVRLERRSGGWDLFYYRLDDPAGGPVTIDHAPFGVRVRFLTHSRAFFDHYLGLVDALPAMAIASVSAGEETVAFLKQWLPCTR